MGRRRGGTKGLSGKELTDYSIRQKGATKEKKKGRAKGGLFWK